MALESPAYVISASSHSADLFRQTAQSMIAGTGVVGSGDLQVSANGTPNMSVNVAAGFVWCPGTLGSTAGMQANANAQTAYGLPSSLTAQGSYGGYNDGTVNLAIAAADPTNPRIDLICASIQDAEYAGSNNQPVLQVVTGSPAASPSVPSAPASSVVLAQVTVAAGATSITTGNITDKRPRVTCLPSSLPALRLRGIGSTAMSLPTANTEAVITDWGPSDLANVGDIAYSGGVFTVARSGLYRFTMSIQWPVYSTNFQTLQYVKISGANTLIGMQSAPYSASITTNYFIESSGDLPLSAGNTVQAAIQTTTSGVGGVIPRAFSLVRWTGS